MESMMNARRSRTALKHKVQQYFCAVRIAMIFMLIGVAAAQLSAQITTGGIVGTVTEANGSILPGATIILENLDTGLTQKNTSTNTGDYTFDLLPIGHYSIAISMPNFQTYKVSQITIAAGDRTRINARLAIGRVVETITVASDVVAVQTDSSTVGSLVDTKAVQDLPLNGRNYINLVTLTPGVTSGTTPGSSQALSSGTRPDDRRQSSSYSANGQDPTANNNLLDGVDNNERVIGSIGVRPSIDAIAEVKVQTNLYSAEIGRTSGGVVNILTRSGSNQFHGSLFEFLRNDLFDSNPYYNFNAGSSATVAKPEYRQNQFGGSLGGPIFKNKTFFFGDYEGLRYVQGGTVTGVVVPTSLQRVGNFSESCTATGATFNSSGVCSNPALQISLTSAYNGAAAGIIPYNRLDLAPYSGLLDSIGLKLASLYPQPASTAVNSANYTATGKKTYFGHTADIKIDHHFNQGRRI